MLYSQINAYAFDLDHDIRFGRISFLDLNCEVDMFCLSGSAYGAFA